ncbi:MAG: SsrA-binding protein SmpB [Microthrixaceae bacterium]|nr:SsrA-binding protein SmpB [Microthrixaceae bacterium]MCO5317165.1 SsrA-binding protein SmpB [Microthrixaceae bacterium]
MCPPPRGPSDTGSNDNRTIATNRRARRDYELGDSFEAGVVLTGSEVKSLREANAQIAESYAQVRDGEVWLHGLHIAPYSHAQDHSGHEPERPRKLLLHRNEIDRLGHRMATERLTLVPLRLYFRNGRVKIELATGKGRKTVDKRHELARREAEREAARAMSRDARNG